MVQKQATHLHGASLEEAFNRLKQALSEKPFLKQVYHEWFDFVIRWLTPGKTLEIGAGNGSFKAYYPQVISSDVVKAPWIDVQADATALPFANEELDNIVGIDVLHHIADPNEFFAEARRVLKPSGRVIFVEPFISPVSYLGRKLFHHEHIDMTRLSIYDKKGKCAMDGNIAIPTLIFCSQNPKFTSGLKGFRVLHVSTGEILSYLFTGGITKPTLLPTPVLRLLRTLEKQLSFLNNLFAYKLFVVLEKIAD